MIPFLDLKAPIDELKIEINDAINRVLSSGWFVLGPEVEAFEQEFAEYCGASYCVGVGNGLDALQLALRALGVGPGDEVIVPSNTYIATWLAVSMCGATPVPVEPDPTTYNMDPLLIESAITDHTKVILPTHLYGQPADLDSILKIAKSNNLRVLEDAAQAHGAKYKGRRIGAHSDVVAWSFYPGKNLGALGDGGAITTSNSEIADKVRVLRNYGSRIKYINEIRGINSRLDPIHAAVLRVKLKYLDEWNSRRARIANMYFSSPSLKLATLPFVPSWSEHAWHLFVVRHPNRDFVCQQFKDNGVQTLIHYPIPPHLQDAYKYLGYSVGDFPIAESIASECLSLPIGPHLADWQVERVLSYVFK